MAHMAAFITATSRGLVGAAACLPRRANNAEVLGYIYIKFARSAGARAKNLTSHPLAPTGKAWQTRLSITQRRNRKDVPATQR